MQTKASLHFFFSTGWPTSLLEILYTSILQCQHVAYASGGLQLLVIMCNQERIQLDNEILRWVSLSHYYKRNLIPLHPNCSYMAWTKQGGTRRLCKTGFIESFGQVSELLCSY